MGNGLKVYICNIYSFEPVKKYYELIKKKFKDDQNIRIYNQGLGGRTRKENIYLSDVETSIFKKSSKSESINIIDIVKFCADNKIKKIDLIKINIEGGEYELLERIIDSGLIEKIDYIQVQFHNIVPDAQKRMERLQRKLSKTHRPTYQYWFIWDNWVRKGI